MAGYKEPSFQDRVGAAAAAREKALAKLKAKPAIDPAELARRNAERLVREAAEVERRAAAKAAKIAEAEADELAKMIAAEAAKAAAEAAHAADEEARFAAAQVGKKPKLSDEEKKAERDAKDAARKSRKGRR